MGGVAGFGLKAEEDGAATSASGVQAAGVDQIGIKNQNVTGAASDLHGSGLIVEVEFRFIRGGSVAAGNDPGRTVFRAIVIKVGNGDGGIAWSLGGEVAVQLLVPAAVQGFASFDL